MPKMLRHNPILFALFIVTTLWSVLCSGAPTTSLVEWVYRGDRRSPNEIKNQWGGMFLSKGQTTVGILATDISLYTHVVGLPNWAGPDNSGYVSTSTNKTIATGFIASNPNVAQSSGWLYKIHAAPNMIDVLGTLREFAIWPEEQEFAALGGFKIDQVYSWTPIVNGKVGKEVLNKAYNKKKFKSARGVISYDLAGFPKSKPEVYQAWQKEPWKGYQPKSASCKRAAADCSLIASPLQAAEAYLATI